MEHFQQAPAPYQELAECRQAGITPSSPVLTLSPPNLCVGLCGDRTSGQIDLAMTRCSYSYTRSGMAP